MASPSASHAFLRFYHQRFFATKCRSSRLSGMHSARSSVICARLRWGKRPMDLTQFFKDLTAQITNWVEIVASLIIAFAVIEATLRAAKVFITPHLPAEAKEDLRLRLGRWLAVALEFELAA